jgi:hypothetical protein
MTKAQTLRAAAQHLADLVETPELPAYLCHVTYYSRLDSIARSGLTPGSERSIGGGAYDSHAAKGVFLTTEEGASFWFNRAEAFAEHNSDNAYEDGLVPMVLSIETEHLDPDLIEEDKLGTSDSKHNAYIYKGKVPRQAITLWDGVDWIDVSEYHTIDTRDAFDFETEEDEETGEERELVWFKTQSPFEI